MLRSLSETSLASHLATLRRDITTHCIEHVFKQPLTLSIDLSKDSSGTPEFRLSMFPSPPSSERLASRLENMSTILTFLNTHLFPSIPSPEHTAFPLSLCKPIRSALLNHFLIPSLPSSLHALPGFLDLAKRAVTFEDEFMVSILGDSEVEREIKHWVDGVGMHYERKRRVDILDNARIIVIRPEDESKSFRVEIEVVPETVPPPEPVEDPKTLVVDDGPDAWGFEDEAHVEGEDTPAAEEDGWGFDEEAEPELEPTVQPFPEEPPVAEEDPGDAWGWNDDDASPTVADESLDDTAWDDPWEEKPIPLPTSPTSPKPATRLEKFSQKGKPTPASIISVMSPPVQPASPPPPPPTIKSVALQPTPPPIKESYLVSGRTRELLQLVQDVLTEGSELASSGILASYGSPSLPSGGVIIQAAPTTLELFRALCPVVNQTEFSNSPKWPMRFSNDCLFINGELKKMCRDLHGATSSAKDKLGDCAELFKLLADSWYEDTTVSTFNGAC